MVTVIGAVIVSLRPCLHLIVHAACCCQDVALDDLNMRERPMRADFWTLRKAVIVTRNRVRNEQETQNICVSIERVTIISNIH